ncbi:MAG: TonB-dependent receptor plug domain-containing protein [Chitinophagaceae bacterium]|nr:TonB-dependent receptor plug domain-containing protein [Chitinophagaceae bacterium]
MEKKIYLLYSLCLITYVGYSQKINTENFIDSVVFWKEDVEKNTIIKTDPKQYLSFQKQINVFENSILSNPLKLDDTEIPVVFTLITEKDIQNSGARDILEILEQVPGFQGSTLDGNIRTIGVRGLYGGDNKILFLVDGHSLNETSFGIAVMTGRIPISLIEKIEIVRGSSLPRISGYSPLATISVKTKAGDHKNGFKASVQQEFSPDFFKKIADMSVGNVFSNGVNLFLSTGISQGNISNKVFLFRNDSISSNYARNSQYENVFISAHASYKGIGIKYLFEGYSIGTDPAATLYKKNNRYLGGHYIGAEHTISKENHKIHSFVYFKAATPLNNGSNKQDQISYKTHLGVDWLFTAFKKIGGNIGVDGVILTQNYIQTDTFFNSTKKNTLTNNNIGIYSQFSYKTKITNIFVGTRLDINTFTGVSYAPQVSFTKKYNNIHYKLLFSKTYNLLPIYIIDNTDLSMNDKNTEDFVSGELEIGYNYKNKLYINANIFYIDAHKIWDINNTEKYFRTKIPSTTGIESFISYTHRYFSVEGSYSFYYKFSEDNASLFTINESLNPNYKNKYLAYAPHKITLNTHIKAHNILNFFIQSRFYSERAYFLYPFSTDIKTYPSTLLLNGGIHLENLPLKNITIRMGVNNFLDTEFRYGVPNRSTPYDSPIPGRTYFFEIVYKISSD